MIYESREKANDEEPRTCGCVPGPQPVLAAALGRIHDVVRSNPTASKRILANCAPHGLIYGEYNTTNKRLLEMVFGHHP
jgi:hypothetical protein